MNVWWKIRAIFYLDIKSSYQLSQVSPLDQKIWLMTSIFIFCWDKQKWILICQMHISHVTKVMTSSINFFCQWISLECNFQLNTMCRSCVSGEVGRLPPGCMSYTEKQATWRFKARKLFLNVKNDFNRNRRNESQSPARRFKDTSCQKTFYWNFATSPKLPQALERCYILQSLVGPLIYSLR